MELLFTEIELERLNNVKKGRGKRQSIDSLTGLELDYTPRCKCHYCRTNKSTYQKLFRFIYGRETKSNQNLLWD